jgi:transcriptional regulator with GAF, ATPase, and Fis domain
MERADTEGESRSGLRFQEIVGGSQAVGRRVREFETVAPPDSNDLLRGENGAGNDALYKAVIEL